MSIHQTGSPPNYMATADPHHDTHVNSLMAFISLLVRYRQLTWEMTRIELRELYAGQVFGILWAVGHPALVMGVYVFVFGYIFPTRLQLGEAMPGTLATYILAGLIPWITFSELMAKGSGVIVQNVGLVKQVAFPTAILPVKSVLASFVMQLVATSLLLLYILIADGHWPLTVFLIPALFVVQFIAMVGVCYVLASVAVYFRDLKDFVRAFLSVGIFVVPILYLPNWLDNLWPLFKGVLYLNPFSHLVWCYQDALYFGRISHPVSWGIVLVLSVSILYVGYGLFNKLRKRFGELL